MSFSVLKIKTLSGDGHNITVIEDFTFTDKNGFVHTIPAGTESDGASDPRFGWDAIPPFGWYWLATVFHDWLYRYSQFEKAICDFLLLEALKTLPGYNETEANVIYMGVHIGGQAAFVSDRITQAAAA